MQKEKIAKEDKFIFTGDRFELTPKYLEQSLNSFSKIMATNLYGIICDDDSESSFKSWVYIVNITRPKIDEIYTDVPKQIEEKIRNYVSEKTGIKFRAYDSKSVQGDVFRNKNQLFGGIPDGEPVDKDGYVDFSNDKPILEIKTTGIDKFKGNFVGGYWQVEKDNNGMPIPNGKSSRDEWFDKDGNLTFENHKSYVAQLDLYLWLRGIKHGMFAVCFLETKDYINPDKIDIKKKEIYIVDHYLSDDFEKKIEKATQWYKDYVLTGKSPIMTGKDIRWARDVGLIKI